MFQFLNSFGPIKIRSGPIFAMPWQPLCLTLIKIITASIIGLSVALQLIWQKRYLDQLSRKKPKPKNLSLNWRFGAASASAAAASVVPKILGFGLEPVSDKDKN